MADPIIKPTTPYFRISEANPLSFVLVQEYNNRDIYRNVFNSKSIQANTNVVDCLVQNFHWEDKIITQFWTNYDILEATTTDENGSVRNLSIDLKVQNLDLEVGIGASCFPVEEGDKTGFYFTTGNTYDYKTNIVNGTYELNGSLPEWAVIGNWMYLDETELWYQIDNIIFNTSLSAYTIVLDLDYYSHEQNQMVVSSKYNRFNYNVYEFVVNEYDKEGMLLNVQLKATDTRDDFINIEYSSENIYIDSEYEKDIYGSQDRVELVYFNYQNTSDIYFSTKWYGILRLDNISFTEGTDNSQNTEKQSTTVLSLSSSNYHEKTLSLDRVPAIMFRKLTEAFSMKEIFIDRIQYTVKSFEYEWISSTNSYDITVELYDAEFGFDPLKNRKYCGDRLVNGTLFEEGLFEIGLFD